MNHSEIVSFIWGVADLIRDTFKRGKYQDVILPLTVLRRLDCVLAPNDRHAGQLFDYLIANPPYGKDWKRDEEAVRTEHERGAVGRFAPGLPRISDGQLLFLLHMLAHPRVSAGSVLVAITGEGQTRGRMTLLQVPSTISQHLAFITPRDGRVVSEYLWRVLQSQYEWLRSESGGAGSTRAALTWEYLKSIKVPVPPRDEQREIAEMIGTIDGRFASLVHRVSNAIDRLKELRIALISAAVTGKIDVRGLA